MLNLFRKQIHEANSIQQNEIRELFPQIANEILAGISCDKIENGTGEFGSIKNPIPVNGSIGEIKYLAKLRGKTGKPLFFHRIGSLKSPVCNNPVDMYQVMCVDGTQENELYFDMYHPRRSNIAPPNYILMPVDKKIKRDLPIGFGSNEHLEKFPEDIPNAILNLYGSKAFARKATEYLNSDELKKSILKKRTDLKDIANIFFKKKENPPFEYVHDKFNLETDLYEVLADVINKHSKSASIRFANEIGKQSNNEIQHFYFDYFLFFVSIMNRSMFPKDNDAYSAIIDGIHFKYYGNVNQQIVDNELKMMTNKAFCFLKTNYHLYKKKDLKMSITIATYCVKKPDLPGSTQILKLSETFNDLHRIHMQGIINEFKKKAMK